MSLERTRRLELEQENQQLRVHRAFLERLVARLLRLTTAGTDVEPLVLLGLLEDIELRSDESPVEQVVRVLRETAA